MQVKELKEELKEREVRFNELIGKMNELTKLMMQIESEKIEQSHQNFKFRELLKKHKINF